MTFGSQTVTFVTLVGTGVFDDEGFEETTSTEVAVTGCRHAPMSAKEAAEVAGDVATQMWQTTAPPEAAAIAAQSTGTFKVDDVTYHIYGGVQVIEDFSGPHHVFILSEIQTV